MSHYTVLVFGSNIEEQISKFDENLEVEEHYTTITEEVMVEMINYYREIGKNIPDKLHSIIEQFKYVNELYGNDWNGGKYIFKDGNWVEVCTRNPLSKYDYYSIGGRWLDYLPLKEGIVKSDHSEIVTGETWRTPESISDRGCSQAPIKYLNINAIKEKPTFAIVDSEGNWHSKGDMGWWGVSSNEKDNWKEFFADILDKELAKHSEDTLLTVLDFHI